MAGPLSGYRILDLSRAIAGPYGSMLLGDLGAEVIKIESPGGDLSRFAPGPGHKGQSFYYMAFNRNKKGLTLDLATDTGRAAFYELVKIADVVWDNFRPGVMERLGADYDSVKKYNPKIICCSISGYGATGPYVNRASVDMVVQGMAGTLSTTGEPGRPPVKPGFPAADIIGGLFGVVAVISALAQRERTGEGKRIDVEMLGSMMSSMAYEFAYYLCSGIVPGPMGSGHLALLPYGVYKCKEGYVAIGPSWPRLAKVIGAEWMIEDPRFMKGEDRLKHRQEFNQIIEEYLAKAPAEDWLELFHVEDIMAGPINTIDKVVIDPQVKARNMILNLPHPLGGEVRLVGNPMKMEGIEEDKYTAPPTMGQHNDEILKGLLKYSDDQIARMREEEQRHALELIARLQKTAGDAAIRVLEKEVERQKQED
ncbi:MAG: CoA transferase [Chloroflexi bacterium]|nr:CoA transferase [Chloroflexota bacterium]MBM4451416.1 CoA transferase [Chloroflexota bacterium]